MANNSRPKEKVENELIGNILADSNQDFFDLRMEMGKSTSAPPPGLGSLISSSPGLIEPRSDPTATEEYYLYYHSIKPHDPRLPLPKWKPLYAPVQLDNTDLRGIRKGEGFVDMGNFASHFDQAMSINMSENSQTKAFPKPQSPQLYPTSPYFPYLLRIYEPNKKILQPQPIVMQQDSSPYGNASSPLRKGSLPVTGSQGFKQTNQMQQNQMQGHQQQFGNQHAHNSSHNRQFHQNKGFDRGQQMYQGGEQQQMGGQAFFPPSNFVNPQMQNPMYYGMNNFQPQMYPTYGMDPNMTPNVDPYQGMQSNFMQGNRMNQMPEMNQMGGMNPYYTPFMGNYYPPNTGFQQQGMPGNFQQSYANPQPNRGQKPMNKNPIKMDIKHIMANLIENCRDQNGSRLIQQHFEKSSDAEKEQIFQQILPHAYSLMTDVFGNYVIQKILELGWLEQKLRIFEAMQGNIFRLSQHTYGCRVVQRTLEELRNNGPAQQEVLEELEGSIIELIEDQNGNHVIQKVFETMPSEKVQFIIEEVTKNIDTLAFHPYGCRVIQRILEHSSPEDTTTMLKKLMSKARKCCECQYGNYIMQYILEKGPLEEKLMLLNVIRDNFVVLSMNKFASNVTEKSVKHGTPEFRRDVIQVLCNTYHENKLALVAMMTHSFGNYVVQRLFECSDEDLRQVLYDKIQSGLAEEIKKNNYGKHVMSFIDKLMENKREY